jgi:tetratricopeptide (TPR) repeat protein
VIGLVQVGRQAMTDHYTYLPLLGIYLACAWRARAWVAGRPVRRALCGLASAAVLAVWLGVAWRQAGFWRKSETLWARALQCTSGNYVAHNQMAGILAERGDLAAAVVHWQTALEIEPRHLTARENLGRAYFLQGHSAAALGQWREAIARGETDPDLLRSTAWILATSPDAALRNGAQAVALAEQAAASSGNDPLVLDALAAAYAESGRFDAALQAAGKAAELAETAGNSRLAARIRQRIKTYQAGKPWRETR